MKGGGELFVGGRRFAPNGVEFPGAPSGGFRRAVARYRCGYRSVVPQYHDPVREEQCLLYLVGHKQNGGGTFGANAEQQLLEIGPGCGVNAGEGLVHQKDGGLDCERACEGNTLSHASRQLVRVEVERITESDQAGKPARFTGRVAVSLNLQRHRNVFQNRQPWKHLFGFLKYHHPVGSRPRRTNTVHQNRSLVLAIKSSNDAKQRGFSTPRTTEQADEFARIDREVNPIQDGVGTILNDETPGHLNNLEAAHGFIPQRRTVRDSTNRKTPSSTKTPTAMITTRPANSPVVSMKTRLL